MKHENNNHIFTYKGVYGVKGCCDSELTAKEECFLDLALVSGNIDYDRFSYLYDKNPEFFKTLTENVLSNDFLSYSAEHRFEQLAG